MRTTACSVLLVLVALYPVESAPLPDSAPPKLPTVLKAPRIIAVRSVDANAGTFVFSYSVQRPVQVTKVVEEIDRATGKAIQKQVVETRYISETRTSIMKMDRVQFYSSDGKELTKITPDKAKGRLVVEFTMPGDIDKAYLALFAKGTVFLLPKKP